MTRLVLSEGLTTFPACRCGARMVRVTLPANQDRGRLSFYRCTGCSTEREHFVETTRVRALEAATC